MQIQAALPTFLCISSCTTTPLLLTTQHASLSILRTCCLLYLELGWCEHEKSPKRLRRPGLSSNFAVRPAHAAARVRRGEVLTQPVIRANMLQGAQLPLLETLNPLDRLPTRRNQLRNMQQSFAVRYSRKQHLCLGWMVRCGWCAV